MGLLWSPARSRLWPFHVFDPGGELLIIERRLPHWSQAGAICFITWRTDDSLPKPVLARWYAQRDAWLHQHGVDPQRADWRNELNRLSRGLQAEFLRTFSERWHENLDACHGECVLRQPPLSQIVSRSLLHFDGQRYEMTDFVVMPNHMHLLAAFETEEAMLEQCESWKTFTATRINRHLGRKGRFWQQDGFDHLVRSAEQFEYLRRYIADNPAKARLAAGEYVHYSKPL